MKKLIIALAAVLTFAGCSDFLEPLPNGHYTDKNLLEYPSMIRGFVEKSYDLLPKLYSGGEYVYLDGATDDAVITAQTHAMRRFAVGTGTPASDPFKTYWVRDYRGIMYVNKFLKDRLGINTRYMIDNDQNRRLQRALQGDAYALRAWWQYDLLRKWGGRGTDGRLLGFPIVLEPVDVFDADAGSFERATYEQCVEQILKDCDSALVYLPAANRDWLAEDISVQGAVRWHRFDGLAVKALKAMTYLQWASPAFNPDNDLSRWENAAKYAAEVMDFKLTQDGAHGFDPTAAFAWTDPNSPEIIWSSDYSKGSTLENLFYPDGFLGTGGVGPTQNLVDAFPAANGYPIDHPEANYDKNTPYANRDPRFYSVLFYNGAEVRRITNNELMYTFDTSVGGRDEAGGVNNTMTNYYIRKYIYLGWNKDDDKVQTMPKSIFFMRWTHMCLIFAEAANRVSGPTAELYGYTPKQALAYLRSRPTNDGIPGVGATADPYLDECAAAGRDVFETLVRNERRIELCFEGQRFHDLRRWATDVSELNEAVYKPRIAARQPRVAARRRSADDRLDAPRRGAGHSRGLFRREDGRGHHAPGRYHAGLPLHAAGDGHHVHAGRRHHQHLPRAGARQLGERGAHRPLGNAQAQGERIRRGRAVDRREQADDHAATYPAQLPSFADRALHAQYPLRDSFRKLAELSGHRHQGAAGLVGADGQHRTAVSLQSALAEPFALRRDYSDCAGVQLPRRRPARRARPASAKPVKEERRWKTIRCR